MRAAARSRALSLLQATLTNREPLRLSFLDGDVVVGSRALPELRGWDWGIRLMHAGIQRLEIDDVPPPTEDAFDRLLEAMHERLTAPSGHAMPPFSVEGMRRGPLDPR
jgi:hypothetical protein